MEKNEITEKSIVININHVVPKWYMEKVDKEIEDVFMKHEISFSMKDYSTGYSKNVIICGLGRWDMIKMAEKAKGEISEK